ncbi:Acetyl-coenzyme A carboxylase carboxyl transferase subunit alpha [Nymphaea thermarum]|nr:Acetyl-coenzyme A carboxylase carboxyl transferase subunit alpha [Nymphaea thermarum]
MSLLPHYPATSTSHPATDVMRSSLSLGAHSGALGQLPVGTRPRRPQPGVVCMKKTRKVKKHDYPWPDPKDVDPDVKRGASSYLSEFKPLAERSKPVPLPFEMPLMELEKKIFDIKKMAEETGLDFSDKINLLENKYQQALKDLYTHLTPIQRLSIARHPNRPTFLDHVLNITDRWVELHGDRAGFDDPAIVTGLGSIGHKTYMFIGHQKGRNTKENIHRNFAMPTPHGYRKALRMMYYADHHGFPIITFIDTPGAFADLKSEEIGQGEAIAHNLRTMFGLKVPIVTVVIGEGGSGGALAIGCANKLLMLENSVFYVASPEACAAILWKSAQAAPKAAEKLRITGTELCKLKIADGIIPEPLGGAHTDPSWTSEQIKTAVINAMNELSEMDTETLLNHRMLKFRAIGGFEEAISLDPRKTSNMKKKDEPINQGAKLVIDADIEHELEKLKEQILKSKVSSVNHPDVAFDEMIEKLKKDIEQEYLQALSATGLQEKLDMLREEVAKAKISPTQPLDPVLEEKISMVKHDFRQRLVEVPNLASLTSKLQMLKELTDAKRLSEKTNKLSVLKQEVNQGLRGALDQSNLKGKLELLRGEILHAGVTKVEDLDEGMKEKIVNVKQEVMSSLSEALKSMQLNLEQVVSREEAAQVGNYDKKKNYADLKNQIGELNDEINKEIEGVVNSSNLKSKLEILRLELAMAEKSSNPESKSKIEELTKEIKQRLEEAMMDSKLAKKQDMLMQEMRIATKKHSANDAEDSESGILDEHVSDIDITNEQWQSKEKTI